MSTRQDKILEAFLNRQLEEGLALARESDILTLLPLHGQPPQEYLAQFRCKGYVFDHSEVKEAENFEIGISFSSSNYLRQVNPAQIVTFYNPPNIFHPNILPPLMCLGRIAPGTSLVHILYQCFEIITYHKWSSHDSLNPAASQWARNHQNLFPVDKRPLKRRTLQLQVKTVTTGAKS